MPDWISIHEPVLVNTIGHCSGAVIFGILFYLFVVNWRRAREERSRLPALAAALAMLWNLGSLIALATRASSGISAVVIVAISFSALSVLPAVLLHISLAPQHRELWTGGYVLSSAAVALHLTDLVTGASGFHYAALLLLTFGFCGLTAIAVVSEIRGRNRAAGSRLAGAMALFLLATSFVHFAEHGGDAWSGEIAIHHAGLPLALLVLLQDYRFLLLDTFVRFILNASLAAGAVLICIRAIQSRELFLRLQSPFEAGLLFVAACLLLTIFVYIRNQMQRWVTRVIFLRSNVEEPLRELRDLGRTASKEAEYLNHAAEMIARFFGAARFSLVERPSAELNDVSAPLAVLDPSSRRLPPWVRTMVPLRFSRGDRRCLLLGSRRGGRRYLSEDLEVLSRLAPIIIEHVEQLRSVQMENLVSQAELKALQAQINPHFLFNSLNTLYGTISRDNAEARRLVLNLADIFRYFLRSDRPLIQVQDELRIVRAYLEVEELRLGSKLRTEMEIDKSVLPLSIPVLSIQPLVENAVKHGVAAQSGNGFIRISVTRRSDLVEVSVSNSGEFRAPGGPGGEGVGLANVRRRLELHYGAATRVDVRVSEGVTTVGFALPLSPHTVAANA
jgi:two-component system, LytTR family, sensor kinase